MEELEQFDETSSNTDYTEPVQDSQLNSTEDVVTVAKEVLAGHWGRGNRRNKRLEDAGFNPAEVNAAVANILKGL